MKSLAAGFLKHGVLKPQLCCLANEKPLLVSFLGHGASEFNGCITYVTNCCCGRLHVWFFNSPLYKLFTAPCVCSPHCCPWMATKERYWGLDVSRIFLLKSHLDWRPPHETQFYLYPLIVFLLNYMFWFVLPARQLTFSLFLWMLLAKQGGWSLKQMQTSYSTCLFGSVLHEANEYLRGFVDH